MSLPGSVTGTDSLFYYPENQTPADFRNENFVPAFEPPAFESKEAEAEALAICKGNEICLFDAATTKDLNFAKVTAQSSQTVEDTQNKIGE